MYLKVIGSMREWEGDYTVRTTEWLIGEVRDSGRRRRRKWLVDSFKHEFHADKIPNLEMSSVGEMTMVNYSIPL